MKFETLHTSRNKKIIIGIVVFVLIVTALVLNGTRAKYRVTQSIPLVRGTINYTPGDIIVTAYYNNEQLETFPNKTSGYSVESVVCDKEATATFDNNSWSIEVENLIQKGTKCDVYFCDKVSASEQILANMSTVTTRSDFSAVVTASSTGTIYTAEDDDGTSYYFVGAATDNYVKFAGYYWRIIRINGDGTIRLIYAGTSAIANGTSSSATQIGTSAFNSSYNDNMYVGFMYTSGNAHGTGTTSTILTTLNTWYTNNLSSYASYIDSDAGFCNDRTPYSGTGTGTTTTYYGAYNRLYTNRAPTLKCADSSDLFTASASSKGNKALTNPIGLITADEAAFAGGVYDTSNNSYYLYTGQYYWTISPSSFNWGNAYVWRVNSDGHLGALRADESLGVRPVINLKFDTGFVDGGTGTSSNPYVVKGAE